MENESKKTTPGVLTGVVVDRNLLLDVEAALHAVTERAGFRVFLHDCHELATAALADVRHARLAEQREWVRADASHVEQVRTLQATLAATRDELEFERATLKEAYRLREAADHRAAEARALEEALATARSELETARRDLAACELSIKPTEHRAAKAEMLLEEARRVAKNTVEESNRQINAERRLNEEANAEANRLRNQLRMVREVVVALTKGTP